MTTDVLQAPKKRVKKDHLQLLRWPGGKAYMVPSILAVMPEHDTYVEPIGGAASMLLNKPPSSVEIYNDVDAGLSNLFEQLRVNGDELLRRLSLSLYSKREWEAAAERTDDPIEWAYRFFTRVRQSRDGMQKSWAEGTHRSRVGMAEQVATWLRPVSQLQEIVERLRRVQVVNRPAIELIKKMDAEHIYGQGNRQGQIAKTLFYCDPPYPHCVRTSTDLYRYEMSDDDHGELSEVLHAARSNVIISGKYCDLYDKLYGDWQAVGKPIANHMSSGEKKPRTVEVLWMNFDF